MAGWWVVFLPETDRDLDELGSADATLPAAIRAEILNVFHDRFKVARVDAAIEGHARTSQIDRLEGSAFPQSFRLQLPRDFRAPVWCLPAVKQAAVVHIFSKSSDPNYRRALPQHDARLEAYFSRFKEFTDVAESRRGRRARRSR